MNRQFLDHRNMIIHTLNEDPRNSEVNLRNRNGRQNREILNQFVDAIDNTISSNQRLNKYQVAKLPYYKYEKKPEKIQKENKVTCPICCYGYEMQDNIRYLICSHMFHKECIDTWLVRNNRCPICRINVNGEN